MSRLQEPFCDTGVCPEPKVDLGSPTLDGNKSKVRLRLNPANTGSAWESHQNRKETSSLILLLPT